MAVDKDFHVVLPKDAEYSRQLYRDTSVHELYVIDREDKTYVDNRASELKRPALYLLVNRDSKEVYVGETDDFSKRIKNHDATKEFWTEAIAFFSSNGSLTTTEVRWLEAKAYEEVFSTGRYSMPLNKQKPQTPQLKRGQINSLEAIFEEVKEFVRAAGFDLFFRKQADIVMEPAEPVAHPQPIKTTAEQPSTTDILETAFRYKPTIPVYLTNLNGSLIKNVMSKMSISRVISDIHSASVIENIIREVMKVEDEKGIHRNYSAALKMYVKYLNHGLSYTDFEEDAKKIKLHKKATKK